MADSEYTTQLKTCTRCGIAKATTEFRRRKLAGDLRPDCKTCADAASKRSKAKKIDEYKAKAAAYNSSRREKTAEYNAKYRELNREAILRGKRERYRQNRAALIALMVERQRQNADKRREKYAECPIYRLNCVVRSGISRGVRRGTKNCRKTFDILGYSVEEMKRHLERQFKKGMSWANYGEWQIDHIVPLSSFQFSSPDDEEFRAAWALTNLRPLWAVENREKGDAVLTLL